MIKSKKQLRVLSLLFGCLLFGMFLYLINSTLSIAKKPIFNPPISGMALEWAITAEQKQNGLMNRTFLAENAGMVFDLKENQRSCFWMKNTLIPLSVAFLDENGRVFQIENMQPLSIETHCPKQPAYYALEVNQGWFEAHGVNLGAQLIN